MQARYIIRGGYARVSERSLEVATRPGLHHSRIGVLQNIGVKIWWV